MQAAQHLIKELKVRALPFHADLCNRSFFLKKKDDGGVGQVQEQAERAGGREGDLGRRAKGRAGQQGNQRAGADVADRRMEAGPGEEPRRPPDALRPGPGPLQHRPDRRGYQSHLRSHQTVCDDDAEKDEEEDH